MRLSTLVSTLSLIWTATAALVSTAQADPFFTTDREDLNVPAHCTDVRLESFNSMGKQFVYGIIGSMKKGFDSEIGIQRQEANSLWIALRDRTGKVPDPVRGYLKLLMAENARMGFDWVREGDVLEALSLIDLRRTYPPSEYYTTGGVSYHEAATERRSVMGEIDLLVARKSDCSVVATGEAKLGMGQLEHARAQLARLKGFLKRKLCRDNSNVHRIPVCR